MLTRGEGGRGQIFQRSNFAFQYDKSHEAIRILHISDNRMRNSFTYILNLATT